MWKKAVLFTVAWALVQSGLEAQGKSATEAVIRSGSTLAVKPMNGFEYYLLAALYKKHIPLSLARDPQTVSYVVEGGENSSRAGTSKVFWLGTDADHQELSLDVIQTSDGKQVMHDEHSRSLAGRGLQTMAEDFANHLRDKVDANPIKPPVVLLNPRVYVAVDDEFRAALLTAFQEKKVPIKVVENKEEADYLLEGDSQSTKADTRRKVLMWNWQSREQAAIVLSNAKDGRLVFAYAYYYESSTHGLRSSAESCAKHLGEMLSDAEKNQEGQKAN
jgi:hypothetical protein